MEAMARKELAGNLIIKGRNTKATAAGGGRRRRAR
jgi:hypothetical protein